MEYFQLVGQTVEVTADRMIYRGRLIEINADEVHLESQQGWITVPIDQVASIELVEDEPESLS